jgi:hypothetical protein
LTSTLDERAHVRSPKSLTGLAVTIRDFA